MNLKSKRQEGVDRISELPNALLCHILSFLPILDAVHTTILSRRWKNLWTSLPELEFDDEGFNHSWTELNRFMMFVDRVLFLHDSTDIKKFSFKLSRHRQCCRGPTLEHFIHIYRWICTALRRNVVELDLDLLDYDCKRFELPQSLFLCKTLEILKVSSTSITFAPPTSACFPSLKVLNVYVMKLDHSVANLFSCCPVLEDLNIDVNSKVAVSNVNISAPRLKTLRIWFGNDFKRNFWGDDRVRFFINAPNLVKLAIVAGDFFSYIDLENEKSLVEAKVLFRHVDENSRHIADRATKLLAGVSNVRNLSVTVPILKALYLPTFENLIQLELILHDCNYWKFLTGFLNNCPVLKHFVFQNNGNTWYKEEYEGRWNSGYNPPDIVPLCLLSHLETISIREFKGQRDEMEVAKYLLKNGEVLSRMTIYTRTSPRTGKFLCSEDEMYRKFSTFEKGSKKCQVEFVKNVRY
ncbi:hypothetical protein ACFX2I_007896 [Malus domestica]